MKRSMDSEDCFMKKFKYYKSNKPKPSLDEVISLETYKFAKEVENITFTVKHDSRTRALGLHDISNWKAVSLSRHPGFIIIKNPFTSLGQRYWIRKCLEEYAKKPNKRNIDIDTDVDNWWEECFKNKEVDRKLQKKLRWATLGYHHDWDTKVYIEDNKGVFPAELAELCDAIALSLGYNKFRAEAAIVNYYHMGSTLSAHTDHSEVNLEAPLFSLSFGQSAIFLLGGHEKSIEPSAILLSSGDIAIMSKDARLCYHAVPKILPSSKQPWNDPTSVEKTDENFKYIKEDEIIDSMNRNLKEWTKFQAYVEESRINVNVRQVLNENQICL
ncbi:nucleic acid dioxygenase ALKBH1 [Pieris napi]|uniref:nucleic acid dioxygenase ALKBH1 n=1 Tax=Pieris napi TaxID=78633 RepID=UPI001FBBCB2E|nr:nucleic acid dioxygenase ALKBH1 [Pieris napi]